MADPTRRIVIGFQHGASLPLRVPEEALASLRGALQEGGDGWHEVEGPDGAVMLDLRQVAFLRVESGEQRVGF
jgi:hypothetical protein